MGGEEDTVAVGLSVEQEALSWAVGVNYMALGSPLGSSNVGFDTQVGMAVRQM